MVIRKEYFQKHSKYMIRLYVKIYNDEIANDEVRFFERNFFSRAMSNVVGTLLAKPSARIAFFGIRDQFPKG